MEKGKEVVNDGGLWSENQDEVQADISEVKEEINVEEKTKSEDVKPKSRIKNQRNKSIVNEESKMESKKENIDLTPEIKEKIIHPIKLNMEDLLTIIKSNANVQSAHGEFKFAKLKFENVSLIFDTTFKDLVNRYNIPDGWTFNIDTGEFLPPQ